MKLGAMRKWLVVPGIVAGVAVLLWRYDSAATSARPAGAVQSGNGTANASAPDVASWSSGETQLFQLSLRSSVEAKSQRLVDFELTGKWRLTALAVERDQVLIEARLIDPKYQPVGAGADARNLATLNAELGSPIYFSKEPDGAISELRGASELSGLVQNMLAYIVYATQFVAPEGVRGAWTTEEGDTMGRYAASYSAAEAKGRFDKRKMRYIEAAPGGAIGIAADRDVQVERSEIQFEFKEVPGKGNTLSGLMFTEATSTDGGPLSKLSSESHLRLQLRESRSVALDPLLLASARAAKPLSFTDANANASATATASRIAGMSMPEVLVKWQSLPASREAERARLFVALSAILKTDLAAVRDAQRRIRQGDPMRDVLLDALGSAGSPDAQRALRTAFDEGDLTEQLKQKVLVGLSLVKAPTEETVAWLATLVDDPRFGGQAQSALGNTVYQSKGTNHGGWGALPTLMNQLQKNQSIGRLKQTLMALGAAGSPAAISQIEPYLNHQNAGVRAAAVTALRRVPGDRIDQLIVGALASDPVAFVRKTAIDVIKERTYSPTLGAAASHAARTDRVAQVRYKAVQILLLWASNFSAASRTLEWIAANDENDDVRQLARRSLEQLARRG